MKQLTLTNPFPNIPSNLFNFLSMQTKSSMQQSAEILPEILKRCVNKIFLLMYFLIFTLNHRNEPPLGKEAFIMDIILR